LEVRSWRSGRRADPGNGAAHAGSPREALGPLQRAVQRSEDPAIETLLARALAATGHPAEAFDRLRLAVSRRPPFVQAFLELGDGLGEAGRFDEGLEVFEAGLRLVPDAAVLRLGAGYIHLRRGDRPKARELFAQARAAAPERVDAMIALARVMMLDDEPAEAATLYRFVLAARPHDAAIRIELGRCMLDAGQREAGEATLRTVICDQPVQSAAAIRALAASRHGRFFLRPSAAMRFLGAAPR
jgi:predicted Zn-dependent protease